MITPEQKAKFDKQHIHESKMIPIKRGCPNGSCFCTGKCEEIIGYREPHPAERRWLKTMSKEEIRNGYEEVQRELEMEKDK